MFFAHVDEPSVGLDEPATFTAGAARLGFTARLLQERGVTLCLNGQGGDEVLLAPLAYLGAALRVVPRTGWRHSRGHAALKNVSPFSLARAALRHEPFAEWLRGHAFTVCVETPPASAATGWEAPPLLPPWATEEAARLLSSAMTVDCPQPIAEDRAIHAAVARIRSSASRAALYRDAMHAAGVRAAMPYFDRAVAEACLSVRPWERTDPWRPKPLLHMAFGNGAPQGILTRRTKGHYNADIHYGWSRHRGRVLDLLDGSRLAELGLIDARRLRRRLAEFGASVLAPAFVTELIAAEVWLRDLAPAFTMEAQCEQ